MDVYIKQYDIGKELLNYIGSDNFKKATKDLSLESTNAFMSGIGMAGVIIMANCNKYYSDESQIEEREER